MKVIFLLLMFLLTGCSVAEGIGIDEKWDQEIVLSQQQHDAAVRSAEAEAKARIRIAEEDSRARIRIAEEETEARKEEAYYYNQSWQVAGRTVFGVIFLWIAFLFFCRMQEGSYKLKLLGYSNKGMPIVMPVELQKLQRKTGAIVRWEFEQAQVQLPDGTWETFLLGESGGN